MSTIPWNQLPKTYQDAVTVVRELNVRYILIDSLCILQDGLAPGIQQDGYHL
ncbi:uncharacterized protein K452DRAFT_289491 [Aplosporella prunicola CBS 121167]|uniref:Heterokaryon incompatibility domain-containing protein n=1 Tax=Aplosporella prunicola CBS 121167 TaxID=1176127 RepID=A0A6A6B9V7_9PEZI|nr:uncharacterized protein K452DRAFT_289491 [Aplosporella prunicola CBS 121167]KAF2140095.1 hypothetical protein K452DRAFT_289491 [Aplosporella prunicola CBS 121167]